MIASQWLRNQQNRLVILCGHIFNDLKIRRINYGMRMKCPKILSRNMVVPKGKCTTWFQIPICTLFIFSNYESIYSKSNITWYYHQFKIVDVLLGEYLSYYLIVTHSLLFTEYLSYYLIATQWFVYGSHKCYIN